MAITGDSLAGVSRRYLTWLLAFVCFVTLFEGYDLLILNLALPYLGREFGVDAKTLGTAVGLINVGTIAAFVPVQMADHLGRRRVFLYAVLGYTVFTLLSAACTGLRDFVVCQFFARMFMVTEIGVGAIILTEEMPARLRGAAVTLMFALSLAGGIVGSSVFPQLIDTGVGWRGLYLIGGAVLPVLVWCWTRLQETQRFAHQPPARDAPLLRALATLWAPAYRVRLIAGAVIWFAVTAWSASCLFFFSYFVSNERGWTPAAISYTLTLGYSLAVIGYATAGPMLDFVGRRRTASLYFLVGACAAWVCFTAQSATVISIAYIVVLGAHALWPIAATITSEMFPTHLRGTANAVVNNLLGRTGMALAPAVVGVLSVTVGSVGQAVAYVALIPLLCLPVILMVVGENRGQELESIQA